MSGRTSFSDLKHKVTPEQLEQARAEVARALSLAELRHAREMTQAQLGRALELTQPGISRIERQTDLYLSTLRSYVGALGGQLDVVARFANVDVPIRQFEKFDAEVIDRVSGDLLAAIELKGLALEGRDRLTRVDDAVAVALALDERDGMSGEAMLVGELSERLSHELDLSPEEQARVRLAGLLRNVGMIYVDARVPTTPGAITLDERRLLQRHAEMGSHLLEAVFAAPADLIAAVRHHHERVDGRGYPDGLTGDEIPFLSRIISVVEAFVAMTHNRPYRDAMPSRAARLRLAHAVDSQFDVAVVAAFEALLAREPELSQPTLPPRDMSELRHEPEHDNVYSLIARRSA